MQKDFNAKVAQQLGLSKSAWEVVSRAKPSVVHRLYDSKGKIKIEAYKDIALEDDVLQELYDKYYNKYNYFAIPIKRAVVNSVAVRMGVDAEDAALVTLLRKLLNARRNGAGLLSDIQTRLMRTFIGVVMYKETG